MYNIRLKEIRGLRGFSQQRIANYLNIKPQQYSRYERGITEMPAMNLTKAIEYLNIDANYIHGLTDKMTFLKSRDEYENWLLSADEIGNNNFERMKKESSKRKDSLQK